MNGEEWFPETKEEAGEHSAAATAATARIKRIEAGEGPATGFALLSAALDAPDAPSCAYALGALMAFASESALHQTAKQCEAATARRRTRKEKKL